MQDLTTGPVTKHLLKTTSFMLVTMVVQTLYFLVDLYWVGRLGTEAVAAVGIAWMFSNQVSAHIAGMLIAFLIPVAAAINVVVLRAYGGGHRCSLAVICCSRRTEE